jgi:hypothetical protein
MGITCALCNNRLGALVDSCWPDDYWIARRCDHLIQLEQGYTMSAIIQGCGVIIMRSQSLRKLPNVVARACTSCSLKSMSSCATSTCRTLQICSIARYAIYAFPAWVDESKHDFSTSRQMSSIRCIATTMEADWDGGREHVRDDLIRGVFT